MRLGADAVAVALLAADAANPPTKLHRHTPLDVAHKLWYHFLYALWTSI